MDRLYGITIPQLDDRDRNIIAKRTAEMDKNPDPRVGDFVVFADGVERRISHMWDNGPQTSDGGSFHLVGYHGCSFSGSLYPTVPIESLTLTQEGRPGHVWIFHHDHWTAHNGVDAEVSFRVYKCNLAAPR